MNIGETIYRLRTGRGMSQDALADALGVSRQSVSKWENGGAVPELDKLMKLAELFGVTLDELVRGEPPEPAAPAPEPQVIVERRSGSGRQTAGTVLLCMAFAVVLLCTVLGGVLTGLILCLPFLACGLICWNAKQHPVLWCLWALFFMADGYLRYGTGLNWSAVRLTAQWTPQMNYANLVIAWCQLLCALALLAGTVWRLGREPGRRPEGPKWVFWALLVLFFLLCLPIPTWVFLAGGLKLSWLVTLSGWLQDALRLSLLAVLLTALCRRRRPARGV